MQRVRPLLVALLAALLAALAGPPQAGAEDGARTVFLVARPELPDPNFRESVVLIKQDEGGETAGVIINRPTDRSLASILPGESFKRYTEPVFFGGPVMSQGLFAVYRAEKRVGDSMTMLPGVYLALHAATLDELMSEFPEFPSPEIHDRVATSMFIALTMRMPQHPMMEAWEKRALSVFHNSSKPKIQAEIGAYLALYHLMSGNFSGAETEVVSLRRLSQSPGAPPIALVLGRAAEALYYWRVGQFEECIEVVSKGLNVANITGVHLWDWLLLGQGVSSALSMGDFKKAEEFLEKMVLDAEDVCQRLGIPYRIKQLCTGELGFASRQSYDIEMWAPGMGEWLEVSSLSSCGDFQARRASIRYRPAPDARPQFVHTLNGSGLALPRVLIALLENHQQPDGSVAVPEVLRPYMGGMSAIG